VATTFTLPLRPDHAWAGRYLFYHIVRFWPPQFCHHGMVVALMMNRVMRYSSLMLLELAGGLGVTLVLL
jgi:hypothetical protein